MRHHETAFVYAGVQLYAVILNRHLRAGILITVNLLGQRQSVL